MTQILNEALRLYELGFGVHWIKPNSKAPVKSGWADGTRETWDELKASYRDGFGLGVRLGAASKLKDGSYLANLDVDIKSSSLKHKQEAAAFVDKVIPGLHGNAPSVLTGYGIRYFFRTKKPVTSRRVGGSNELVKVLMPTAQVSSQQIKAVTTGIITQAELDKGFRVRGAWEVEIMGAGKQVVLPPSIHPDTKKLYAWGMPVTILKDLPLILDNQFQAQDSAKSSAEPKHALEFTPVDIDYMDARFSSSALRIVFGENVGDRSAAAFSLSISMLKSGFSDNEVLSVLTDRDTFIGETAFDHRNTTNRLNAARWAFDYCLRKAKIEADAAAAFRDVAIVRTGGLTADVAAAQRQGIVQTKADTTPWQQRLSRSGKDGDGGIKPTLENTLLIIQNVVSPAVFRRDVFAQRDSYGTDAPWTGAKKGKALTDDDAVAIKVWLGRRFGFEPSTGTLFDAMTAIALNNAYHPVQDELRALPAWDGRSRLNSWLRLNFQAEGEPAYLAQVFRKWLIAAVTRTFEPGAKFDWLPILEGPQGIGKSMFGAILFGQKYFADWLPSLGDKDAALGLVGRRCVEFAELDRMRRNEVETVKAFVTRQVDMVRPPYGRKSVEYARGCVFFGTTNREAYLQDDTGNRRFCPVKVGALDFHALERDRDQLWAEALFNYDMGFEASLYLEGDAIEAAFKVRQEKQVEDDSDAMADVLGEWLEKERTKPAKEQFDTSKFSLISLFGAMGPFGGYKYEIRHAKMASKAIRKLGGTTWKSDGNKVWKLP